MGSAYINSHCVYSCWGVLGRIEAYRGVLRRIDAYRGELVGIEAY